MSMTIDNQRDFIIGKPLSGVQAIVHQPNIQREVA